MKKSLWLLSLLWILILSGCGWSNNIIEYNDSFVAIVKECTEVNQALFQTFESNTSTLDSIADGVQANIEICSNASKKASELWDYEKDSSLKDAVIDLLDTEVEYLQKFAATNHYRNIDNLTDEDKEAYDAVTSDLNATQNVLNQKFTDLQDVQEAFAAKHGLKLENISEENPD